VVLRDLGPADVDPFVNAFVEDPPLTGSLGHDEPPRPGEVRAMLRLEPRQREVGERVQLAMADPETDALIGDVVLHSFHWRHRRAEVGFFVVPAARRKGVAAEAVRLASDFAFDRLGIERVALVTTPENDAAHGLARRLGFTREGVLRSYTFEQGRFVDNVVFSLLAGER
jgi:RimJ/RimL family protein N-acetyltransferase